MGAEGWELVFMMFILKLPILYLAGVVWWAVRSKPDPFEPAVLVRSAPSAPDFPRASDAPCPWRGRHPRPSPQRARRGRPAVVPAGR